VVSLSASNPSEPAVAEFDGSLDHVRELFAQHVPEVVLEPVLLHLEGGQAGPFRAVGVPIGGVADHHHATAVLEVDPEFADARVEHLSARLWRDAGDDRYAEDGLDSFGVEGLVPHAVGDDDGTELRRHFLQEVDRRLLDVLADDRCGVVAVDFEQHPVEVHEDARVRVGIRREEKLQCGDGVLELPVGNTVKRVGHSHVRP